MTDDDPASRQTALDKAREKYSKKELLIRYARGRVAYVWMRQTMTVLGAIVLGATNGVHYGLAALALALLGEAVDCLFLRRVPGFLNSPGHLRRAMVLSTVTGAFQALTIAICVGLGWFGPVSHDAPLFALAFLLGTTINAGLVLPYHRPAAIARLAIYSTTLCVLLLGEVLVYRNLHVGLLLNVAAAAMLIYMTTAFLAFVNRSFETNRRNTLNITRSGMELSRVNARLLDQGRHLRLLSLVANHANDIVILSDPNSLVAFVNTSFTRVTGYGPEEVIGKRLRHVLQFEGSDPQTMEEMVALGRAGIAHRREVQIQHKDGRALWIEVNRVPVKNAAGEVETIVSVDRDITKAKEHEAELRAAKRASEESARAKAEFLATMSHEIRTPMNGIIGMADLIAETELTEDQTLYAETIRGSAQGLLAIINDILDLSKLDAQKMSLAPTRFDLRACLESAVQLLRPQADAKGIDLRLDLPDSFPEQVFADDARLRQILLNLIGNAVKFTAKGHVTVSPSVQAKGQDLLLSVAVTDTGVGIPPQKLGQIFERFAQAETTTTRRFGGTGLGLTISKLLAEAMGGDISVTSQPGTGSCFTLSLVLRQSKGKAEPRLPALDDDVLMDDIRGLRILVAEDNRVNRIVIEKYLANVDIDLHFAVDGEEAVWKTVELAPDLIFMDMSMPVMGGVEATRRIRASGGPQPIIVALTANAFASDRAECLKAGMDGFLSKPVRRREILEYLSRHARALSGRQNSA